VKETREEREYNTKFQKILETGDIDYIMHWIGDEIRKTVKQRREPVYG